MIPADDLLFTFRWNADTLQRLTADIPCERFAEQPVEGMNHPAWLIGHVSTYSRVIAALLRGESFDSPWDAPQGKNSAPVADRTAYGTKEEILEEFSSGSEAAIEAIRNASEDAWQAPMSHPTWGKQFDTVAPAVVFLATAHLALHIGQLSGWRRAAGLPRV